MVKPARSATATGRPDPAREEDRASTTRRGVLSSAITMLFAGGFAGHYLTGFARADAAVTDLTVAGDSITTDNGQLTGLTTSVSGHVSYNGLDTEADTVEINLSAAPSGGESSAERNRIASTAAAVAVESGMGTHAGHADFSFVDADVLTADDLSQTDFAATGDGTAEDTDVEFRIAMTVLDIEGTVLVDAAATATATISVTNEPNSANTQGNGNTNAQGTNQSP